MHASAYEVGLRDVFLGRRSMFTDLYIFLISIIVPIDSNSIVKRKPGLEHKRAKLNRHRKDDGIMEKFLLF